MLERIEKLFQKKKTLRKKIKGFSINPFDEETCLWQRNPQATDFDEIPQGRGEFGYSKDNPIPVCGKNTAKSYLDELVVKMNFKVFYQIRGRTTSRIIMMPIEIYDIFELDTENLKCTIYISIYHKNQSLKFPRHWSQLYEY